MNAKEKAARFLQLLVDAPGGLHKTTILRKVPFGSDSSFYRSLRIARTLGATIECEHRKYHLKHFSGNPDSLAVTSDDELIALASIQHILSRMTAGALEELFDPLRQRIGKYLSRGAGKAVQWSDRIKILDIHFRNIVEGTFNELLQSVAHRRAVKFRYTDSSGKTSERVVSPQQIVRYKDNWYLDAWCHDNNDLRIFSLDGVAQLRAVNSKFVAVPAEELRRIYATSYGLFSGIPNATAVIRFTGIAARYALRETWHPQQVLTPQADGSVHLEIPFNKSAELVKEILSWGSEAEVIKPKQLRHQVADELKKAALRYE